MKGKTSKSDVLLKKFQLKSEIRQMEFILDLLDRNCDRRYEEFAGAIAAFEAVALTPFEERLRNDFMGQNENGGQFDPIESERLAMEHAALKHQQAKMARELSELEADRDRLAITLQHKSAKS
jgi:hypothetical protein